MSGSNRDALDGALSKLPHDIAVERDLWPDIRQALEGGATQPPPVERGERSAPHWYRLAAAVLLVVGSSLTTLVVMREPTREEQVVEADLPQPTMIAMPASFAGHALGGDYAEARAALDGMFEERLKTLPPSMRTKVQRNLNDIRVAAREIADTLAEHPSDPLLQELLMSTYQSELRLLTDVAQLAPVSAVRVDL